MCYCDAFWQKGTLAAGRRSAVLRPAGGGEATAAQARLSPGRTRSLTPRRCALCGLGVRVGAGCGSDRPGLPPGAPSAPSPPHLGPGAPPRPMGRVGLAGRVSGAPAGSRGGSASPGGSGREAVALGRAAAGREDSGRLPEPPAPSGSGAPPCFPCAPAATFLYLPRVAGASNSSSLFSIHACSCFRFMWTRERFSLPSVGRVYEKLLGS